MKKENLKFRGGKFFCSIPDYPAYEVCEDGTVWSLGFNGSGQRQELKKSYSGKKKDYATVSLCNDKGRKTFSVRRLVAEAFVPNPENKTRVWHKDGDRKNNNHYNLYWAGKTK